MISTSNLFTDLPNEIWIHIFVYLSGDECMKLSRVCKYWFKILHHNDEEEDMKEKNKRKNKRGKLSNVFPSPQETSKVSKNQSSALSTVTNGYYFWVHLCEEHFTDAMVRRRLYPSRIRPVTFYVFNYKLEYLQAQTRVWENCVRSIEQAMEEYVCTGNVGISSLSDQRDYWIHDVCIFSEDLFKLYRKTYLIDKYYDRCDTHLHPFEKYGLEEYKTQGGIHLEKQGKVDSSGGSVNLSEGDNQAKKLTVLVKLNDDAVQKAFNVYCANYFEMQGRKEDKKPSMDKKALFKEMIQKKFDQVFVNRWIKLKWKRLLEKQENLMREEKQIAKDMQQYQDYILSPSGNLSRFPSTPSTPCSPDPFAPTVSQSLVKKHLMNKVTLGAADIVMWKLKHEYQFKSVLEAELGINNSSDVLNESMWLDIQIISNEFNRKNELRMANNWLNRKNIYTLHAQRKLK